MGPHGTFVHYMTVMILPPHEHINTEHAGQVFSCWISFYIQDSMICESVYYRRLKRLPPLPLLPGCTNLSHVPVFCICLYSVGRLQLHFSKIAWAMAWGREVAHAGTIRV